MNHELRRGALSILALAIGIGITAGAAFLRAEGPDAWWTDVLGMLLTVPGLVMALVATAAIMGMGTGSDAGGMFRFVPAAVVFFASTTVLFNVGDFVEASILTSRGRTTPCVVLKVDSHTYDVTNTDANGHTTTTTRTYHDHRLDCVGGRPTDMRSHGRSEKVGASIVVRFDPAGRIEPRTDRDASPAGPRRTIERGLAIHAGTALVVMPLVGLGLSIRRDRRTRAYEQARAARDADSQPR